MPFNYGGKIPQGVAMWLAHDRFNGLCVMGLRRRNIRSRCMPHSHQTLEVTILE
jgi:hypothetical protein